MKENIAHIRLRFLKITETFIYEEIKNIRKYRPFVFCIKTENLDKFPFENIESLSNLNPFSYAFNSIYWLKFKKCPYFEKVIRKENIKLLHAQYGREGIWVISLKDKFGIPLVTNFRGWDSSTFIKKNPRVYDELFQKGDLFLARCQDMKKDLITLGCPEKKIIVHHSSIDLKKFRFRIRKPVDKDEKIKILLVGRFVEAKGIDYAIKAFAKVKENYENIYLTIIGDGPEKSKYKKLIRALGITNDVKLTGYQPHNKVIEEMEMSHIYMCSPFVDRKGEKEGTNNAFAEAQATGMPTIGTYHAGIPEAVINGKTGFLVKEKDIDGLSDKLSYLIEHQDLWGKLGRNGRKHVEKEFNMKIQSRNLEKIYDAVLSS